eukprot:gene3928-6400_t
MASISTPPPADTLSQHRFMLSQQWYDPNFSPNLLTRGTILEYFGNPNFNPFYERGCLNERQRQENIDSERLKNYEGIEYTVHHTQDPVLQVILKKKNSGNKGSTALAYYYVARGNTFQAPDLCSLVSSRLTSVAFGLQRALEIAQEQVVLNEKFERQWLLNDSEESQNKKPSKYRDLPLRRSIKNPTSDQLLEAQNHAIIDRLSARIFHSENTSKRHHQNVYHSSLKPKRGKTD